MKNTEMAVSVIVSTYNWPQALGAVLSALEVQTFSNFEVIVADDGSKEPTRELVQDFQRRGKINIKHVWQPDDGYRLAQIRNKAIVQASGAYVIFLDGDSIPLPTFLARHVALAKPGWFVAGSRILLDQPLSERVLRVPVAIHQWSFFDFLKAYRQGHLNRISTLVNLPLGVFRYLSPSRWRGAKGCNLAIWREDLLGVNGCDESYIGWGYEDSDLLVRLLNRGVRRKSGKFSVPILHLWHPQSDRASADSNYEKLQTVLKSQKTQADEGLSQYL